MLIAAKPTTLKTAMLVCLLAIPLTLQAQIYKQTDEQGNVTFTDQPTNQAETIDVPPPNTATPIEIQPRPEAPKQKEASLYQSLRITAPENDSIIPNGSGDFSVQISLSPALQDGHQIQLLLNGKVHQSGSQSLFELTSIPRGNHTIEALVANEGAELIRSKAIKVQVYRPSSTINNKRRPPTIQPVPKPKAKAKPSS
jgi:hypothetical protein